MPTDRFRELIEKRRVRTPEGSDFYGLPIGAEIGGVKNPVTLTRGHIDQAVTHLQRGHRIELEDTSEVHTLVQELGRLAMEAQVAGVHAKPIDLCRVSVKGTNIFCGRTKGVPRKHMPQLAGIPTPGTPAASLPPNKRGKVDIGPGFTNYLARQGTTVERRKVPASWLHATQNQIDGVKVAVNMTKMEPRLKARKKGGFKLKNENPIFVSRDGYIIDGHHHWAAAVGLDAKDGHLGDVVLKVDVIDMDIMEVLYHARRYAQREGLPQTGFGKSAPETILFSKAHPVFGARHQSGIESWTQAGVVNPDSPAMQAVATREATLDDIDIDTSAVVEKFAPRKVRTLAGVKRYKEPIGTPISPEIPVSIGSKTRHKRLMSERKQQGTGVSGAMSIATRHGEDEMAKHNRVFEERETYEPDFAAASVARSYRAAHDLPEPSFPGGLTNIKADLNRGRQMSVLFLSRPIKGRSDVEEARTRSAYRDLVNQTEEQYAAMEAAGITVEYLTPEDIIARGLDERGLNPYPTAKAQRDDVAQNGHLMIASIAPYRPHPYLDSSLGGEYDRFRAVHDYFGHAAVGTGFDRHGEYQAWLHHASMFTGNGRLAATSELHLENSTLYVTNFHNDPGEEVSAPHNAVILAPELADPFDDDGTYKGETWLKMGRINETQFMARAAVAKLDKAKQNVFGWAYVTHDKDGELNVDKSGEFVRHIEQLEDTAYDFVLHSRQGGVNHARIEDAPIVKSTMIESVVFTPEKLEAMGIPQGTLPSAWWVGFHVDDPATWQDVEAGLLTSFSVHGSGIKKKVDA